MEQRKSFFWPPLKKGINSPLLLLAKCSSFSILSLASSLLKLCFSFLSTSNIFHIEGFIISSYIYLLFILYIRVFLNNENIMILSFELPFALLPLLKFTSSKTKMGSYANSFATSALTWIISSFLMAINIYYLITSFIKLLLNSQLQTISKVFSGIFGFAAILVYLAAVIYLALRKNRKNTQPLLSAGSELSRVCDNAGIDAETSIYNLPREDIVSMQLPQ